MYCSACLTCLSCARPLVHLQGFSVCDLQREERHRAVVLPVQSPRGDRKGLLSPKRKSDTSAFQAFMTPQKHSGGHLAFLLHKEIMPLTAGFALTVPGFLSLLHTLHLHAVYAGATILCSTSCQYHCASC